MVCVISSAYRVFEMYFSRVCIICVEAIWKKRLVPFGRCRRCGDDGAQKSIYLFFRLSNWHIPRVIIMYVLGRGENASMRQVQILQIKVIKSWTHSFYRWKESQTCNIYKYVVMKFSNECERKEEREEEKSVPDFKKPAQNVCVGSRRAIVLKQWRRIEKFIMKISSTLLSLKMGQNNRKKEALHARWQRTKRQHMCVQYNVYGFDMADHKHMIPFDTLLLSSLCRRAIYRQIVAHFVVLWVSLNAQTLILPLNHIHCAKR